MIGDSVSLLQTRQRLQALADLGHYKGDVGAAWGPPAIEALKQAQAALGVTVDGKWGPQTEDAIQVALKVQMPCESLEDCAVGPGTKPDSSSPPTKPTDAVGSLQIVGAVVGGLAVAGLTAALVLTLRARSSQS